MEITSEDFGKSRLVNFEKETIKNGRKEGNYDGPRTPRAGNSLKIDHEGKKSLRCPLSPT